MASGNKHSGKRVYMKKFKESKWQREARKAKKLNHSKGVPNSKRIK